MKIFGNTAGQTLAADICKRLSIQAGQVNRLDFADQELWVQLEDEVRGHDVYLICPTQPPAEHWVEALFLADAARHASAGRITMVIPYLGYARQDRKDARRTAVGAWVHIRSLREDVDRVILLDVHAEQTNALFRPKIVDHLYSSEFFIPKLEQLLEGRNYVIAAPDVGAGARARKYNSLLNGSRKLVYFDKARAKANQVESVEIVGKVKGHDVVFVDDIIDTGGTMVANAEAAIKAGATDVIAVAPHALLSKNAVERIDNSPISTLVLSDTVVSVEDKITLFKNTSVEIVTCSALLADAIRSTHDEESVSRLIL